MKFKKGNVAWNKGTKGISNGGFRKGRISENKGKTVALGFTNLKRNCELCGKEYTPRIRVASRQKFCSKECTTKSYKINHPEEQAEQYKRYNRNNPTKYQEHIFVMHNKKEINKLIGEKCALCSNVGHAHHLTYFNLPHGNLKEYSKALMPLCPKHHSSFHQVMNKYGGIE